VLAAEGRGGGVGLSQLTLFSFRKQPPTMVVTLHPAPNTPTHHPPPPPQCNRNALIYRAREKEGRRPVVLKHYDPRRSAACDREVRLLADAGQHPGLVRLEALVEAPGAVPHLLVLEACGGGTLIEAIANSGGRLPERVAARRIVAPLLRALAHLHARGIVHRCVLVGFVSNWCGV